MPRKKIAIRRGLDLPIAGVPETTITPGATVRSVGLLGTDYTGLKPTMLVAEGDTVRLGQPVFEDKKNPGVIFTAPATGRVSAINRGARRALRSVVIDIEDPDDTGLEFTAWDASALGDLDAEAVTENLVKSGIWTGFRCRPFNRVPEPGTKAGAVFVTAMDTHPLAGDPTLSIAEQPDAFVAGVTTLTRLTEGTVYICCAPGAELPEVQHPRVEVVEFAGPHPAGLAGTHIHFLSPVSLKRTAWHIKAPDVIGIGHIMTTGRIWTERLIALGGPMAKSPRILRTRLGACTRDLIDGEIAPGDTRVIGGSVLGGHRCAGWGAYLGRYEQQITLLPDESPRRFLHWLSAGSDMYTSTKAYVSGFMGKRKRRLTTSQNGSARALVPIGNFERVMPLDILPMPLLKALVVKDTDTAQALGALELDVEDLALSAFVCPSKYDYPLYLRESLAIIEKEG